MNKLQSQIQFEIACLEKSICVKEEELSSLPDGELKCYSNEQRIRRYIVSKDSSNRIRRYLGRDEVVLAEQLAIKGLLQSELRDETIELKAMQYYLKHCSSFDSAEKYLSSNDDILNLVSGYKSERYKQSTKHVQDWLSNRCGVSAGNEHQLRVKTHAGFNVRSKSERDILHALMDHGLPYKYEERIFTDVGPLFPDFTILNPLNGQEVIWEHNGSMDDPNYAAKVFKRTAAYYRKGFHPGKNLINTYEENNEGIDSDWIETIIKQYFTNPYI